MSAVVGDTLTLLRRELIRYRRDRAYWIGQIVFPLAIVGFLGFGLDEVITLPSGTSYVGHLATGVLALLVGSGAVGGGFSLIEDRESGFLRSLLIAPVSRTSIVLSKLAARILASLLLVGVLVGILAVFTPVRVAHGAALLLAIVGISHANPLTYGVDLLRYGLLGVHEIGVAASSAMLVLLTVVAVAIAIAAFDRGTQR